MIPLLLDALNNFAGRPATWSRSWQGMLAMVVSSDDGAVEEAVDVAKLHSQPMTGVVL